jgi:ABC-type lipoprotein export system ATPase subunit
VYTLTGVTKLYRKSRRTVAAVRDLNLAIGDGEWLAVQGRTGHGKSTLLEHLWRERGLTLVMVTHDTSIARRGQRVGVMNEGRLTIHQATRPA